jgi:hypothetical protein
MFVHNVYFWFKDGTPESVREEMLAGIRDSLTKIHTGKHVWGGRPAMTPRDAVDNSYDVGLCVVFANRADHDSYQVDPVHLAFGDRFKAYWKRTRVYDFQDQA